MTYINALVERFIVWRYVTVGMLWGCMLSYSYMGEPVGWKRVEKRFLFWEKHYVKLGYKAIEIDEFVTAGGYEGAEYLIPFICQKEINN